MKATTIRLVWYKIWDVGTVDISHPRLANYTFMRRSIGRQYYVRMAGFFSSSWRRMGWMRMRLWGRQAVRNTCSFSRSKYWISGHRLVHVCSLSRSFEPPIFRQLILPTNAMAMVAARRLTWPFSCWSWGSSPSGCCKASKFQNEGRHCCSKFMSRTCRSCPPSCSWVLWPGQRTTE